MLHIIIHGQLYSSNITFEDFLRSAEKIDMGRQDATVLHVAELSVL